MVEYTRKLTVSKEDYLKAIWLVRASGRASLTLTRDLAEHRKSRARRFPDAQADGTATLVASFLLRLRGRKKT